MTKKEKLISRADMREAKRERKNERTKERERKGAKLVCVNI